MLKWLKQYSAITRNTFVVLLGDPIFLIMHVFVLLAILLIASLPGFTLGGQLKLVRDQLLALSFVCGCLLSAIGAVRVVGDDLRKGMIATIMSRPVSPLVLLSGKCTGLILSVGVIFVSSTIAALWATRLIHHEHSVETLGMVAYLSVLGVSLGGVAIHHYIRGGNYLWQSNIVISILFPLTFFILNFWGYNGMSALYGSLVDWETAFAFIYIFMALMVFSSMVIFCSVLMDISMILACAVILFFLGLFSDYILSLFISTSIIRAITAIFIPDWQMFWVTEFLMKVASFASLFFWSRLAQAIFQTIFFIIISAKIFKRKEVM